MIKRNALMHVNIMPTCLYLFNFMINIMPYALESVYSGVFPNIKNSLYILCLYIMHIYVCVCECSLILCAFYTAIV